MPRGPRAEAAAGYGAGFAGRAGAVYAARATPVDGHISALRELAARPAADAGRAEAVTALADRLVRLRAGAALADVVPVLASIASLDVPAALRALGGLRRTEPARPSPQWPELPTLLDRLGEAAVLTGIALAASREAAADFGRARGDIAPEDGPLALETLGRQESHFWAAASTLRHAAQRVEEAYGLPGRRAAARASVESAAVVAAASLDRSPAAGALAPRPTAAAGLLADLRRLRTLTPVATAQRVLGAEIAHARPAADTTERVPRPEGNRPVAYGTTAYADVLDEIAERSRGREEQAAGFADLVELLRGSGLGGFRVPREYGGSGGTLPELLAIVTDIAERNPSLAHVVRTHFAFVEARLRSTRSAERERWLREAASGVLFANLAGELTATVVGAGARHSTELVDTAAGPRLRGRKFYSTGSPYVDRLAVSASHRDGTVLAVVPVTRAGVHRLGDWDGFGQVLTGSGTTEFADVEVRPGEIITGGPASGEAVRYFVLGQIYILAIQTGILRAVVTDGRNLLHRRTRTFSNAAASSPVDDPQLHRVLGGIAVWAEAAEALVQSAATALDEATNALVSGAHDPYLAREFALRTAKAKVVLDDVGPRAANAIFDLGGASATRRLYNLDRHWRNLRTVSTHNPAATKARVLGEYLTDPAVEFPALW
ncbi:acyl-CoA dehydrogenase family protein [Actinacidiphila sp. ITFR-21]|uniref:acyl-CoA dehydrogenase family protein n=1 Tax=Actinacidiphila sp. ITFR-21 TaxID=3075199 RepID=UPI00288A468B|nr:acyl-CoA dehydrogenase family protein [Streptomyces sp. ITFR-21]WNI14236.1 acyl-CoA dehydrogenase family protein [Streptomyces sp. ITFR-21]